MRSRADELTLGSSGNRNGCSSTLYNVARLPFPLKGVEPVQEFKEKVILSHNAIKNNDLISYIVDFEKIDQIHKGYTFIDFNTNMVNRDVCFWR
jgi:hypothetical protein